MNLLIYCAGGLGREILGFSRYLNSLQNRWDSIGFVDDVTDATEVNGAIVYRYEEALKKFSSNEIEFVIASGEPYGREKLYQKLVKDHLSLTNLINPCVYLSYDYKFGRGVIINDRASISTEVVLEDNVLINGPVALGHDVVIKKHCVVSSNVFIGGKVTVGEKVFIGAGALLRDRLSIGEGAILAMGSVVFRNVKHKKIVLGNPAKVIGENKNRAVFGMFG